MKFIEKNGKFICHCCGYMLVHNEYRYIVSNCPKCGEKVDKDGLDIITEYDDHRYSGLTDE